MGGKDLEFGSVDHCFPDTLPVPRTLLSMPFRVLIHPLTFLWIVPSSQGAALCPLSKLSLLPYLPSRRPRLCTLARGGGAAVPGTAGAGGGAAPRAPDAGCAPDLPGPACTPGRTFPAAG